jgi:hypothetical protein
MNRFKHRLTLAFCLVATSLLLGLTRFPLPNDRPAQAQSIQPHLTAADPVTNKELVRNGAFDQYDSYNQPSGWYVYGTGAGVDANAGQDGGPVLSLESIMDTQAIARQELHLPSQTTAATFAFDYRLLPTYGGWGYLQAGIMQGDDPSTASVVTITLDSGCAVGCRQREPNSNGPRRRAARMAGF